jgi:hypothetical protein
MTLKVVNDESAQCTTLYTADIEINMVVCFREGGFLTGHPTWRRTEPGKQI